MANFTLPALELVHLTAWSNLNQKFGLQGGFRLCSHGQELSLRTKTTSITDRTNPRRNHSEHNNGYQVSSPTNCHNLVFVQFLMQWHHNILFCSKESIHPTVKARLLEEAYPIPLVI